MPSRNRPAFFSKRAPRSLAAAFALATIAFACGGSRGNRDRPKPSLSSTAAAAYEMSEIDIAWQSNTPAVRLEIKQRLERFLSRYGDDGAAPLARVYLAIILLDAGDLAGAERELVQLRTLPPGATNDFATIARAEALRARSRSAEALELLRPLAGKLVDRAARERFDETIVRVALEAHVDFEALTYMDAWLRNTEETDRESVRERVKGAVDRMSVNVLVPALTTMRRRDTTSGYGRDIQRIVTNRVAELAVESDDAKLAQWLVDADAGAVVSGETEILVSELATRQAGGTAFIGRTIGLIMPTATSGLRDAGGEVARGVAWALELPRTKPGAGDETRLITRDDTGKKGQLESQLEDLAAEGAGIILAALDHDSADRAIRWSEATGVPVITLAAPVHAKPRSSAFVIGEPTAQVVTKLTDELVRRRETKIAIVADSTELADVATVMGSRTPKLDLFQPAPCELEVAHATETRFPLEAWEKLKFRTWLVAGSESCARDVVREVGNLSGALVALSLQATGRVERGLNAQVISAAAGMIPVLGGDDDNAPARARTLGRHPAAGASHAGTAVQTKPAAPTRVNRDPEIARYVDAFGSVPTWRAALGRDAAMLARQALKGLPLDTARTSEEVLRRRDEAKRVLVGAREKLWSSEQQGFDATSRVVPRTVRIIDLR